MEDNPWWSKNRISHFLVVYFDLSWRIIKTGADVGDLAMAVVVSWKLTRRIKEDVK